MEATLARRTFTQGAIGSLLTFSFLETLTSDLFASKIRPFAGHWLAELDALGREVKDKKLKQVLWQKQVEALFKKVDLPALLKLIDFEQLAKKAESYKGPGPRRLTVKFPEIEGVPTQFVFGRQIFALKKDRAVVPHGHDNMATAFLILKGKLRGRHYERIEDQKTHMIIEPTIDREFGPGGTSTVSDKKDNIHWFKALEDGSFIFNIHVLGLQSRKRSGRVYVDPNGEKLEGGRIRGRRINHGEATKLYG